MFLDARRIDDAIAIDTTVCIIGGGVAGITLALEMEKAGIPTCLLESGGHEPDNETRALNRGVSIGFPYRFGDDCRSRFLGGASNCWGGWCRPLDPWDFETRDWVANSGWPVRYAELTPYYVRSLETLRLGPYNFEPDYWVREIGRPDVRRIPLDTSRVQDTISQFSPPLRFGKAYRAQLAAAQSVRSILFANVVNIETDANGVTATSVRVATLSGRRFHVRAKVFVLAAGGIENPRLLLASRDVQKSGLGNAQDLVGRYYMDHPRIQSGIIHFRHEWQRNKLFDIKFQYQNAAVAAHGTKVAGHLFLPFDLQREERLLNAQAWFSSNFPGEGTESAQALIRAKQAMLRKIQPGWSPMRDLLTMLAHPIDTVGYAATRFWQPRALIDGARLQAIVEPEPDPESRVTLSSTEKDRLGMPLAQVEWRLGEKVKRTFDRIFAIMGSELEKGGVAQVALDPPIEGKPWPDTLEKEGTWHHMGATRMHDSPKHGVVDRDCKVHGMSNLYVAGSSVFPTAGANFPTITITALALRLAERLVRQMHA
jgi:choline dehydrogenase-like flavoprotein